MADKSKLYLVIIDDGLDEVKRTQQFIVLASDSDKAILLALYHPECFVEGRKWALPVPPDIGHVSDWQKERVVWVMP
jgi:hypothetical protein